jgi:NitT/TauT family transport system substrate-binding protein
MAVLGAAAAVELVPVRARAQASRTLRVAVPPSEDAAAIHFADEMGFLAKAGLAVDIQTMQNNPAIAAAVASGAVDIGHGGVDTLAASHSKGIPLRVIAPSGEYVSPQMQRGAGLFVPAASPVRVARDLNGKIAAVAGLHGLTMTATCAWIDTNGGDSSTMRFIEVAFPSMAAALASGRVDAAFITEPFLDDALKSGRALAYGFDSIARHFLVAAWFANTSWIQANPDAVARFSQAMHETALWANRHPDQSAAIFVKFTKMDPAVIAKMVRGHYAEQMTPALMQPLIDASAKDNGFAAFPAQELMATSARSAAVGGARRRFVPT